MTSADKHSCGFRNLSSTQKGHARAKIVSFSSSMEDSTGVDSMRASDQHAAATAASSAHSKSFGAIYSALQRQSFSDADLRGGGRMNILPADSPSSSWTSSSTSLCNELFRDMDRTTKTHKTVPDLCSLMSNLDARPHISSLRRLRKDRLSRVKQMADRGLHVSTPKSTKCESLFSINRGSRGLQKFSRNNIVSTS